MISTSIGGARKITYLTLIKLARDIQNNYTVSAACRNAHISRQTFYRYLNNEPEFTEMIIEAYKGQSYIPMFFDNVRM
jgi:DNA invertase Pin-like site-specific DNA recombinase